MRTAYRVLADLVAIAVVFQAAVMVWAIAGLGIWIENGGVLNKAVLESDAPAGFTEELGFMLHGLVGQFLIPVIALALLVVSFFAKIPKGVQWAVAIFVLTLLQVFLGLFGHAISLLGLLHGIIALALFMVALLAVSRSRTTAGSEAPVAVA